MSVGFLFDKQRYPAVPAAEQEAENSNKISEKVKDLAGTVARVSLFIVRYSRITINTIKLPAITPCGRHGMSVTTGMPPIVFFSCPVFCTTRHCWAASIFSSWVKLAVQEGKERESSAGGVGIGLIYGCGVPQVGRGDFLQGKVSFIFHWLVGKQHENCS